ncbi:MAG: ATP-binding cassette domain-containing protein [Anaerolineales bacterium]
MIEVNDLTFQYPDGALVFDHFSWAVGPGEAWSILGPSGCGKTTLLYLLAGLRSSSSGSIRIGNEPLSRPRPRTGLILQDFGLLPWSTVHQNASLGLRIRGFYGPDGKHAPPDEAIAQTEHRVGHWLERLGLTTIADSYPSQISGGQRQRTAIARTLAMNPDLLLMDEPFASLDAPTREGLQDLTWQLQHERSLTTVLVTHSIEEAALMGSHVLILGKLPNHAAQIFIEPGAADPGFRASPAYAHRVSELRAALEGVA